MKFLRATVVTLCAAALAACSQSGSGRVANGPAATAMPTAAKPNGSYIRSAANLAPDPDALRRWTPGTFVLSNRGPGGSADLEMTGTGEPQGSSDLYSPPVALQTHKTYVFSLWIDPSNVQAGSVVLGIYSPTRMVTYGQVRIKRGAAGRYSVSATLPSGANQVRLDFQPNGATIVKGKTLSVAQPMLLQTKLGNS